MEYAGTYNFSQKESNSSVQLCVKLVGDELKRPVTAAMYPVSGTAEGMHGVKFKSCARLACMCYFKLRAVALAQVQPTIDLVE